MVASIHSGNSSKAVKSVYIDPLTVIPLRWAFILPLTKIPSPLELTLSPTYIALGILVVSSSITLVLVTLPPRYTV
jgi:hypothetical protein